MDDFWNRSLTDKGLISYRHRGRYGWIMIGARDDEDALREARRSWEDAGVEGLERWDGERYVKV